VEGKTRKKSERGPVNVPSQQVLVEVAYSRNHQRRTRQVDHWAITQPGDTETIVDGVWNELNPPEDKPPSLVSETLESAS
jgi:hypothetical protein